MKFTLIGSAGLALGALALVSPSNLQAGWGHLRGGSSGGSSGYSSYGSSGSSGGYTAAYGSSGYAASYGSSGYSASYASSGGSSGYTAYSSVGGSSGGSSGGPGLLQRVAGRLHDHMAAKRARHASRSAYYGSSGYASSGGSSGYSSYGSSGGYSTSYRSYHSSGGSSGGAVSYGSSGHSSGVSYGVGGVYYGASTATTGTAGSLVANTQTSSNAVYLTVAVPSEARVFVNGKETTSTGAVRKFVSHGLKAGKQYRFQLRAEMTAADGSLMTEEKSLVVAAGEQEQVQFAFAENAAPIETAVTLNLPEGAKVLLAGNETNASGATRTFRTVRLKPGQVWENYEIEVQYEDQVKRQSVRLIGGDQLQLTFDFEAAADQLAAR